MARVEVKRESVIEERGCSAGGMLIASSGVVSAAVVWFGVMKVALMFLRCIS